MAKTALITGGSGTIGSAAARLLARDYNVVIGYGTNKESAQNIKAEIISAGGEAEIFCADVACSQNTVALAAFVADRYGRIDVLVNSSGIALYKLAAETTDQEWQRIFDVNVKGVFNMCRAALPHMISQKSGAIINVSSMWGITGAACETAYSASKAAVIGYTKALAKELAPSGITVNAVAPGFVDSGMNAALGKADRDAFIESTPLGRAGTPQDIADTVLFLAKNSRTSIDV